MCFLAYDGLVGQLSNMKACFANSALVISLQGLEVERECCQFKHWAMTTAFSNISSRELISKDASA